MVTFLLASCGLDLVSRFAHILDHHANLASSGFFLACFALANYFSTFIPFLAVLGKPQPCWLCHSLQSGLATDSDSILFLSHGHKLVYYFVWAVSGEMPCLITDKAPCVFPAGWAIHCDMTFLIAYVALLIFRHPYVWTVQHHQ